jgi:uncharacterized membrane protein YkoI
MHKRMLATAGIGVVALGIGGATAAATAPDPASERNAEAEYTAAHRSEARVSPTEAERAAKSAHPGSAFDTHLENEGAGLRWETKIVDGSRVWEVQVDAASGRVVSSQPED